MANRAPNVYYRRMITFVIGLLLLFVSVMTIFYVKHKSLLLAESNAHLSHIADLITDHFTMLEQELEQRVSLIHSNALLQQYMFIVARLEGEPAALQRIYKEQVRYLPGERNLVMTTEGVPIVGSEHKDLIRFVSKVLPADQPSQPEITYFYTNGQLEMLVSAGIFYKDQIVGRLVIGHTLDKVFLQNLKRYSGGDIFLFLAGRVLQSTLEQANGSPEFTLDADLVTINGLPYRVRHIALKTPPGYELPELWLGVNQQKLFVFLNRFLLASIALTLIASAAILAFGIHLIHRIIKPIQKLMDLTRSVADGKLPEAHVVPIRDEMDYLTSGFHSMVTGLKKQRQKLEEAHEMLLQQSITDPLTGTYNRRYFDEVFPKMLSLHKREGTQMYILLMDLDHFKRINDTYGHACGDAVLVAFAEILRNFTRKSDFCFRIGGEEFVLLLNSSNFEGANIIAEKIRARMEVESISFGGTDIFCTISIGLVENIENVSPDEMLELADKAMYNAKRLGRNRVWVMGHRIQN